MKLNKYLVLLACFLAFIPGSFAQEGINPLHEKTPDSLGVVSDEFQEYFFEALKQKAIENYEKSIKALEKCAQLQPDNAVVYFEMGKNYLQLKKYDLAVKSYQNANRLKPDKEDILIELMNAYYLQKNYDAAIIVAKTLTSFDDNYQDDLAKFYYESGQFEKLIALLDQLDLQLGVSAYRNSLRQQIYAVTNNTGGQIKTLQQSIKINPEDERNYLNLIYVYSDNNNETEALKIAEEMRIKFPTSRVVHLALYKFYLNSGETEKALNSMKLVLQAEEIDSDSKFKVLNDFLRFVNDNPQYEDEFEKVVEIFSQTENDAQIYEKLGAYYLLKTQKEKALDFFMLGIMANMDNYELVKNTLLLQLELNKNKEAEELSSKSSELFPSQPLLYLLNGVANNRLSSHKAAVESLEAGLDYLLDDVQMESDFYEQLIRAFSGLGNKEKAAEFQKKRSGLGTKLN